MTLFGPSEARGQARYAPLYADREVIATCLWCGEDLVDGKEESCFTGEGPDYMTDDGDYGCNESPDTGEDGTGSHTPNRVKLWDGHAITIHDYDPLDVEHPEGCTS